MFLVTQIYLQKECRAFAGVANAVNFVALGRMHRKARAFRGGLDRIGANGLGKKGF